MHLSGRAVSALALPLQIYKWLEVEVTQVSKQWRCGEMCWLTAVLFDVSLYPCKFCIFEHVLIMLLQYKPLPPIPVPGPTPKYAFGKIQMQFVSMPLQGILVSAMTR